MQNRYIKYVDKVYMMSIDTGIYHDKSIRINTKISGIYADKIIDLKRRGIVRNNTDAICQGLMALKDKTIERDLAIARLKTIGKNDQL